LRRSLTPRTFGEDEEQSWTRMTCERSAGPVRSKRSWRGVSASHRARCRESSVGTPGSEFHDPWFRHVASNQLGQQLSDEASVLRARSDGVKNRSFVYGVRCESPPKAGSCSRRCPAAGIVIKGVALTRSLVRSTPERGRGT
jgi:hypothetical protein